MTAQAPKSLDSFKSKKTITAGGETYSYYSLPEAAKNLSPEAIAGLHATGPWGNFEAFQKGLPESVDEATATARLIKAIENPYTTILGHPTGRLLLAREGYPIDHKAVIQSCAKHGVTIELNANPHRLGD